MGNSEILVERMIGGGGGGLKTNIGGAAEPFLSPDWQQRQIKSRMTTKGLGIANAHNGSLMDGFDSDAAKKNAVH